MITLQKITDPNIVDLDGLERSFNKALKEKSVTPDAKFINIGFAVGKAYSDLGETTKAFNILNKANQLHEALHPYDTGYVDKLCFTLKHIFSPIDFKELDPDLTRPKTKRDDKKMIFIVGMPRSPEQVLSNKFSPVIPKCLAGGNSAQWARQQANFYIISHANLM